MVGTASPSRRWLLIEHPGPWAVAALDSPGIPAARQALQAAVVAGAGRVQLIRRPGRQSSDGPYLWVVLDHDTGRRASGTWRQGPEDTPDAGLLEAAQALAATAPAPGAGQPPDDPLLLVCAHGRHDVCCAVRGRPVAAALAQRWPDLTWECSHVGGDRFAANLVCLPHGHYFGRVEPQDAARVVGRYEREVIDLDHYRGRCSDPPVVQAAEWYARDRTGLTGRDELVAVGRRRLGDRVWATSFSAPEGVRLRVVVRAARDAAPRLLTDTSPEPLSPLSFTLLDLRTESGEPP